MSDRPEREAELVVSPAAGLARLARDVDGYVQSTRAEATRAGYARDWRSFHEWAACPACPVPERLPPPLSLEVYAAQLRETGPAGANAVALYVAELVRRGRKLKTIERAVAAITVVHRLAGLEPPTRDRLVRATLVGVRRQLARAGRAASARKSPLTTDIAVAVVHELDADTLAGQRDIALVCFGVASGRRREELARTSVENLQLVSDGIKLNVPWSKTDQQGEGLVVPISYGAVPSTCPVRTLQRWLVSANINSGPLFRRVDRHGRVHGPLSPRGISEIVKRCAARVGLDAADFAGHSLRAGFVTSAYRAGKSTASIQRVTGHRDVRTLSGYDRAALLFQDAANRDFGL